MTWGLSEHSGKEMVVELLKCKARRILLNTIPSGYTWIYLTGVKTC